MALDLGKQIGPLPLGAWIAVVGGGLAFAYYTSRQTPNPDTTALDNTSTDPGVGLGGVPAGYGVIPDPTDTNGTGTVSGITDNDSWGTAAVNALVARGFAPGTATTAVSKYLSGETLSNQESADVNLAIMLIGAPPSLPQSSIPPSTNPSVPPPAAATFSGAGPSDKTVPGPLGHYVLKQNASRYNINGKAVATNVKNAPVYVFQWGKIGTSWYAKSVTYYYRASDLVIAKKTTQPPSVPKPPPPHPQPAPKPKPKPKPAPPKKPQHPKAPAKPKVVHYTVKHGDSLSSIAKRYHTTWQKIYSANHKKIGSNPNVIRPGLVLTIP